MSVVNNNLLLTAPDAAVSAYQIQRSLRFNSADSAYLNRTPSVAGNRKTWTWSGWVKRCVTSNQMLFNAGVSGTQFTGIQFYGSSTNQIEVFDYSSAYNFQVTTTPVYRDTSAWMHVLVAFDATNATTANRVRIYVNGSEVTTFATASYPANTDRQINSTVAHNFGRSVFNGTELANMYLADVHFIDGQALTPSSFTETNATTGQLVPKAYTGTYGTNGFRLNFSDNSAATAATLGADSSGNGNNWTPNNLSVTAGAGNDSLTDTPTSYGTDTGAGGEVRGNYATLNPLDGNPTGLTNGNLDAASANAYPTIIPGSGQWYYEVNGTGYTWNGTKANWTLRSGSYNFGQRPFAYAAPSGFKALCDTNLPIPTIAKGSSVFDTALYTGTGTALTPTSSLAFSPDLVWIKSRSGATDHALYDTVRGATLDLVSNSTAAETTQTQGLTVFASNGFSVGTLAKLNTNAATYAGWCWNAGSSTVTNTAGTITSQVRANASAGFSVVSWTGTGATGGTIGHGLNVVPEFIICKSRTTATSWPVYHKSLNSLSNFLELNVGASTASLANYWGSTAFTSNVFNASPYGTSGANWPGASMIAYCFAPVTGYSSFGSYTGNGSADGPFVYTGFRPRWVLWKKTSTTSFPQWWAITDSARIGYNAANYRLYPNVTNAEDVGPMDILSNGFKLRANDVYENENGATYIYAAFAENPFQFARAR